MPAIGVLGAGLAAASTLPLLFAIPGVGDAAGRGLSSAAAAVFGENTPVDFDFNEEVIRYTRPDGSTAVTPFNSPEGQRLFQYAGKGTSEQAIASNERRRDRARADKQLGVLEENYDRKWALEGGRLRLSAQALQNQADATREQTRASVDINRNTNQTTLGVEGMRQETALKGLEMTRDMGRESTQAQERMHGKGLDAQLELGRGQLAAADIANRLNYNANAVQLNNAAEVEKARLALAAQENAQRRYTNAMSGVAQALGGLVGGLV